MTHELVRHTEVYLMERWFFTVNIFDYINRRRVLPLGNVQTLIFIPWHRMWSEELNLYFGHIVEINTLSLPGFDSVFVVVVQTEVDLFLVMLLQQLNYQVEQPFLDHRLDLEDKAVICPPW